MKGSNMRRGIGIAVAVAVTATTVAVGLATLDRKDPRPQGAPSPAAQAESPTPEATTTSSPTPATSPTPASSPVSYPSSWKRYSSRELGISFVFPSPGTNAAFEFIDAQKSGDAGYGFEWWAERPETYDKDLGRGWRYSFAAAHTKDFSVGRHGWITDLDRWYWKGSNTMVVWSDARDAVDVEPLRTVKTSIGLNGLIFDPRGTVFAEWMNDHPGGRVAMLNLPASHDRNVRGITFYFYEKTSVDDIEKVLRSVELSPDGPSYR